MAMKKYVADFSEDKRAEPAGLTSVGEEYARTFTVAQTLLRGTDGYEDTDISDVLASDRYDN